jgi:hypothetical protein
MNNEFNNKIQSVSHIKQQSSLLCAASYSNMQVRNYHSGLICRLSYCPVLFDIFVLVLPITHYSLTSRCQKSSNFDYIDSVYDRFVGCNLKVLHCLHVCKFLFTKNPWLVYRNVYDQSPYQISLA